jgi:cysteine peptidase B
MFILLGLLLCVSAAPSRLYQTEFENFLQTYEVKYDTVAEYRQRLIIFSENVEYAAKLDAADPHAEYGVTQFMDLTRDEFKRNWLISNFSSPKMRGEPVPVMDFEMDPDLDTVNLPPDFDWRSRGVVTGVYNQGQCGSCWAFSTTENIESMWARAGHGLENLSMQQLVDCDRASDGCGGGNPPNAFQYVIQQGGIDTYGAYPYAGRNQACHFNPSAVGARVSSWGYISTNDNEAAMLNWVANYGPPSACVDAQVWQYYRGGVITGGCGNSLDHCIQITGWATVSGIPAWVVRNSWGTGWGYAGYLYVQYGTNMCGIGQECQGCSCP